MTKTYISPQNKIAAFFIILTFLVFGALILGLFKTAYGIQIIITPQPENVEVNFTIITTEQDSPIKAKNFSLSKEKSKTFYPEATVAVEDYAEGEIILTNQTNSPINFVASTRFASPAGLIFRAIERIYIPPQGNTTVAVRADKIGPEYEIEPTEFTIPNLKNEFLKNNIKAESTNPMTGGLKKTGVIMQSDIDQALKEVEEELYQKGLEEIKSALADEDLKIIIKSNLEEESVNALAGEEKTEFTVFKKIKIVAVAITEEDLLRTAQEKLKENIPVGKKLIAHDPDISCRLKESSPEEGKNLLEIQFRGYMIITKENEILEPERLVGLKKTEIQEYLNKFKEIQEVKIKSWPPFLADKIFPSGQNIKIKIN
jgi:hypothetical protein